MSLEKLISEIAASHPVATRAQRVTGVTHRVGEAKQTAERAEQSAASAKERVGAVEETLEGSDVRGDDGVPPGYPTVTAETFFHQVDLYWPRPPASDEVAGSLVRIRPENEASRIVSRPSHSATIKNLPHKPHTFEVLLFDKWGRESRWSDPVSATPMLTAAEEIDLGEIAMLGRLRGLLPDTNLATITDATKLADELVSSGKIAPGAVTGPKLPDGVINGPKIAVAGVESLNIANDSISTTKLQTNAVNTRTMSAESVTANQVAAEAVTTPKLAAGSVVADKIAANSVTAPKILADSVQTRHITAGAVTASVMAAQDAAAFNLWAQNAMIRSAAIQSITADKITAGTMTAGQIAIAGGGSIRAGQVVFSSSGIEMPSLAQQSLAAQGRPSKITSLSENAALYFMDTPQGQAAVVQGDSSNSRPGSAILAGINNPDDYTLPGNATMRAVSFTAATNTPSFIESHSRLFNVVALNYAYFRTPNLIIDGNLDVRGGLVCTRYCTPQRLSANGGGYRWSHNSNNSAILCQFQASSGGGIWRPIEFYTDLFVEEIDANTVLVRNNRGGAFEVRGWIFDVRQ